MTAARPGVLVQHPASTGTPSGIGRYSLELAAALEALGEPVRRRPVRRLELRIGHRGFGGLALTRLQLAATRPRRGELLHATHLYMMQPRADVVTVHDTFPETYRSELGRTAVEDRLLRATLGRYVARGTLFVMDSAATRDSFLALHPEVDPDRTHVVHLGVEPAFRPAPPGAPPHPAYRAGALNVLCVADLNPRKRVDWLLEAAASQERPLRVVQAGSRVVQRAAWGAQRAREEPLARRLGDRFLHLGPVPHDELVRLYQGADLFVLPSLDEGFGFPPLEALRCGTPVAVPDRAVFREVLGERAAFFRDADGLAAALARFPPRPPTPAERSARSRWVARTYTWRRTAERTRAVYGLARESRASSARAASSSASLR
jgi:glycosyltransferase involved in cell wall biosynthesis